jgi:hypothetical protein
MQSKSKSKNPVGRPLKFKSAQEMQEIGDKYFAQRAAESLPFTITGLAIALGTTRESLCEYEERPGFVDTIKGLKARCQDFAETKLFGNNPTGSIFWLKNYGWKDKQEVEISGNLGLADRLSAARKRVKK